MDLVPLESHFEPQSSTCSTILVSSHTYHFLEMGRMLLSLRRGGGLRDDWGLLRWHTK